MTTVEPCGAAQGARSPRFDPSASDVGHPAGPSDAVHLQASTAGSTPQLKLAYTIELNGSSTALLMTQHGRMAAARSSRAVIQARVASHQIQSRRVSPVRGLRRLRAVACLLGTALAMNMTPSLPAQSATDGRTASASTVGDTGAIGMIGGTLIDAGNGQPMPYATIMLTGTERESFADAQGHFRFTRLAFDTYHLLARQIGYAPVDTTIVLTRNAASVNVTRRMQRVVVRLPAIAILGSRARGCVAPGVPDSTADPALAGIFTQVRENADRSRMLLEGYPFRYRRLETFLLRSDPGGDSTLSVDTTTYESSARHPYQAGRVVYADKDSHGHPERVMYLPTFRDLSDSVFLGTHCFSYGGTEDLGPDRTDPALRINFRPGRQHPLAQCGGLDLSGFRESHYSQGGVSIGECFGSASIDPWPHRDDDVP